MKVFKYKAIKTTPANEHVGYDRVKEGETYLIAKDSHPNFVRISGKIYNRMGGFERVTDKAIQKKRVEKFVKLI